MNAIARQQVFGPSLKEGLPGCGNALETYAGFVEAMAAKQVFGPISDGEPRAISKLERNRNWSLPSYEFGSLLDPTGEDWFLETVPTDLPDQFGNIALLFSLGPARFLFIRRYDDDEEPWLWLYNLTPNGRWESRDSLISDFLIFFFAATYVLQNSQFVEIETTPRIKLLRAAKDGRRSIPGTSLVRLKRRHGQKPA